MKEHPMIFSPFSVQATLAGRKNMTRRLKGLDKINENPDNWYFSHDRGDGYFCFKNPDYEYGGNVINPVAIKAPYQPGDVLWVRETWQKFLIDGGGFGYTYKANNHPFDRTTKWRSPRFMPKAACRLRLEIIDERPERLQDISESDAIAEGVESNGNGVYKDYLTEEFYRHPKQSYLTLWTKINGKGAWDRNDWVWVISYKML